jgi:hypothetical protein
MGEVIKSITGGGWSFIVSWVVPSATAVGTFALYIFPHRSQVAVLRQFAQLDETQQLGVGAFLVLLLALVLGSLQDPLYRILEGYLFWPNSLRRRRVEKWRQRLTALQETLKKTEEGQQTLEASLIRERLVRFPSLDQVAPTRFGNVIRAGEVYGYERFRLDSQILWFEIVAVVPEPIREEYEHARAGTNFFVALWWLALGFAFVTAVLLPLGGAQAVLVGPLLLALASTSLWRAGAVSTAAHWASVIQAGVDLARRPLAEALGLAWPHSLRKEREMWVALGWFTRYPGREDIGDQIDEFRETETSR